MDGKKTKKQNTPQDLVSDTDMSNNMDDFDDLAANIDDTSEGVLGGQSSSTSRNTTDSSVTNQPTKGKQGFGSMDPNMQRTIASQGGKAAHEQGKAHEWNSDEAKNAGRIGGSR